MSRLDFSDPAAVAGWLGSLQASLKDANAVSQDMLLPPRERQLGPALHAENYAGAWKQVRQAMERAGAPLDIPKGGEDEPPAP